MRRAVTVTGVEELIAKLKRMDRELRDKVARKAIRAAAVPVLRALRDATPTDTGNLRRSWGIRIRRGRNGELYGTVAPRLRYGYFVEHGHRIGRRSREVAYLSRRGRAAQAAQLDTRGGKVPPHPFAQAAIDRTEAESVEILKREYVAGLRDAASKAGLKNR